MFHYFKRFWKDNLVVIGLLFITGLCQTIVSVWMASALDSLIDQDLRNFFIVVTRILAVFIIYLFFTRIQMVKTSQTIQKTATAIRLDITKRIEQTSYNHFHERQVGTYASWLSNDVTIIESEAFGQLYMMLTGIIGSVTSVVALFFFHWSLGVWTLVIGGITILLPKIFQRQMGEASLYSTKQSEHFLSQVTEFLAGFDTLFSYSLLGRITEKTQEASLKLADAKNKQAGVVANVTVLAIFGNILGQLSVGTLTGFLAWSGVVAIGAFAATTNLAITIFNTLGGVSNQWASIRAVRPIFEKFDTIEKVNEEGLNALSINQRGIQLDGLNYAYGDKTVLKNISFDFNLGGKYAIVGASGSGKSTLLNILIGKLTDYSGSATFSDMQLNQLSGKTLRESILYIDQAPYLFSGTIRDNITLDESFSEEAIQKVIEEASLEDIIEKLPEGLDTSVGEAGRLLSGGQRQRIALARGLIRGKRIILVDEGTSSLDEASALKIEENLVNNPELTVIMITHHLRDSIKEKLTGVLALT